MPWWGTLLAILGAGMGVVVGALRALYLMDWRSHNWKTCRCARCDQKRRIYNNDVWTEHDRRAKIRRNRREEATRRPEEEQLHIINDVSDFETHPTWKHTGELDNGMVVEWQGEEYLVKNVKTVLAGYYVELTRIKSKVDFIVQISFTIAGVRMWHLKGGFHEDDTPPWERR